MMSDASIETDIRSYFLGSIGAVSPGYAKQAGLTQNPALIAEDKKWLYLNLSYFPYYSYTGYWSNGDYEANHVGSIKAIYSPGGKNTFGFNTTTHILKPLLYQDFDGNTWKIRQRSFLTQFKYARVLNRHFNLGLGVKYYQYTWTKSETRLHSDQSIAFDVGFTYFKKFKFGDDACLNLQLASTYTNFGVVLDRSGETSGHREFLSGLLRTGLLLNQEFIMTDERYLDFALAYQADTPFGLLSAFDDKHFHVLSVLLPFYDASSSLDDNLLNCISRVGFEARRSNEKTFFVALRAGLYHNYALDYETAENNEGFQFGLGLGVYGFTLDLGLKKLGYTAIGSDYYGKKTLLVQVGYSTNMKDLFAFMPR